MAPMTHSFFLTCSAAPVDTVSDEVETPDEPAGCVLVTVSVAVRMPAAVATALSVDLAADSVLEAGAEIKVEVEMESDLTSLVVMVVEVAEVLIAFELTGVADEEAALQVAFPRISLGFEKRRREVTYRW